DFHVTGVQTCALPISDLAGLKVRVMESPTASNMVKAMGSSPTPVSYGELYTALQQGIVDAAENNAPSLYTSKHYEVCKYYSLDRSEERRVGTERRARR